MKKKLLSLMLALVMVLGMVPLGGLALAADGDPVYTVNAPANMTIEATAQRQDIGNPTVTADSSVNFISMRVVYTMLTCGDKSIGLTVSGHKPGTMYSDFDPRTGCVGISEMTVYDSQASSDGLITTMSATVNSDDLANAAPGTYTATLTYAFTIQKNDGNRIGEVRTQTLTLVIPETAPDGVAINETNFPDANFREFVKQYDTEEEGKGCLSDAELAAVTRMECNNKSIADLKGIEHFTALKRLWCYGNKLISLDMSHNTALMELYCDGNQLTSLDVSHNTALTSLDCFGNQLTSLDVSGCAALEYLSCYWNQLTSLDVSHNTALTTLICNDNELTGLDVSAHTALTTIWGNNNNLTSLDVSGCTALKELDCFANNLTSLDVSAVPAIRDAVVNGTKDSSDPDYDAYTSEQGRLYVDKTVTIITETAPEGVAIDETNFPDANFREFVKQYDTEEEGKGCLSAAELAAVTEINCNYKNIADLKGIEHFTALEILTCTSNNLTSLDVSANTALTGLFCGGNKLTSLNVSANTALTGLACFANNLTSLDVSANTALTFLNCDGNQLPDLNLSANTALVELICNSNQLTSLDVSAVPAIRDAVVNGTKDSSGPDVDYYHSEHGQLTVDKTVTIITESTAPEPVYTVSAPADKTIEATAQRQDIGNPTVTADSSVNFISMRVLYTMLTCGDKSIGLTVLSRQPGTGYALFDAETGCVGISEIAVYDSQASSDGLITTMSADVNSDDLANAAPGTYTATLTYAFTIQKNDGYRIGEVRTQTLTLVVREAEIPSYTAHVPEDKALEYGNTEMQTIGDFWASDFENLPTPTLANVKMKATCFTDGSNTIPFNFYWDGVNLDEPYFLWKVTDETGNRETDVAYYENFHTTLLAQIDQSDWDAAVPGTYTATLTFNFSIIHDIGEWPIVAGTEKTLTTTLTVVVPERTYTAHVPEDKALEYGNTEMQTIGDFWASDFENLPTPTLANVKMKATCFTDGSNTIPFNFYWDGVNLDEPYFLWKVTDETGNRETDVAYYENFHTTLLAQIDQSDWDAAVPGTYTATLTFNFSIIHDIGEWPLVAGTEKTLTTTLTVVVPERTYTAHVPEDKTLQYGNTGLQTIGDFWAGDFENLPTPTLARLKMNATCFTDGSNTIPFNFYRQGTNEDEPFYLWKVIDPIVETDGGTDGAYTENYLTTLYAQIDRSDWDAAVPGTYTATLTFNYSIIHDVGYGVPVAGTEKTLTTTLTVVVPERTYTAHVPEDKTLEYGNTGLQTIGDYWASDFENLPTPTLARLKMNATCFTDGSNTIPFNFYRQGTNEDEPFYLWKVIDPIVETDGGTDGAYTENYLTTLYAQIEQADWAAAVPGTYTATLTFNYSIIQDVGQGIPVAGTEKTLTTTLTVVVPETATTVIPSAAITLDAPVIGAQPDYTAEFPEGANYYSDAYNEGDLRNDIGWVDMTTHAWMNPDTDVFRSGREYEVTVYLTPRDGYEFTESTTATVNGQPARVHVYQGQLVVEYTFITEYPLWLGETQVTSANKDDILGDQTASFDPETNTLTFTTETPAITGLHSNALIYARDIDLTINAAEKLTLTNTANYGNCISVNSGKLTVNGDVDLTANDDAIFAVYGITVNGNVDAESSYALYTYNGSITVSGDVTTVGRRVSLQAGGDGNIEIGGSLHASGGSSTQPVANVYAGQSITVGGDLTVENEIEYTVGIWASGGTLTLGSGRCEAKGNTYAIVAKNGIVIPETHSITTPENGKTGNSNWSLGGYTVLNEDDTAAKHVIIEPISVTYYPLWLGETQVTSENAADILGDQTASFDPETNTLTFTTETPDITGLHEDALIYADGIDLTIKAADKLTLVNTVDWGDCVVAYNGALTINGDVDVTGDFYGLRGGSVTVNGDVKATCRAYGIYSDTGDITVNGNVDVTSEHYGIYCDTGDITVNGNVNVTSDNYGIYTKSGDITVNGNVMSNAKGASIIVHGNVIIGGSLTATGAAMTNVYWSSVCAAGNMTIGGDVKVENEEQYDIGILCYGTLTVGSGRWEAEGAQHAIWAQNGIVLPETHGVTTPENGVIGAAVFHGNDDYDGYSVLNEDGTVALHAVIEKVRNIKGDVTGDDIVDNRDLILVARYLVHLVEFDERQLAAADWNGDGLVNNSDLVQIARYIVSENG